MKVYEAMRIARRLTVKTVTAPVSDRALDAEVRP
jgi:hypothetical protein